MVVIFLFGILVVAFGVVVWMVHSLKKEAREGAESEAVPISDLKELDTRKEEAGIKNQEVFPVVGHAGVSCAVDQVVPSLSVSSEALQDTKVCDNGPQDGDCAALREEIDKKDEEIKSVKEEIRLIREKAVIQAKNALEVINKLRALNDQARAENERLISGRSQIAIDEERVSHLRAENAALREQLDAYVCEANLAAEKLKALRAQQAKDEEEKAHFKELKRSEIEGIVAQYQARIDQLVSELGRFKEGQGVAGSLDAKAEEELKAMKMELDDKRELMERLEARVGDLETAYAIQKEKNNFLQYELTKSRAQASGLERVSDNSRKQVETLARQVSSARLDNKELRQQADVFEKSFNDFKRLNAELIKRERLSQFELKRSRDDMQDLERIHDSVRARLHRTGLSESEVLSSCANEKDGRGCYE